MNDSQPYDLIVLGAGVVGITTAYWAMRAGLSVAVIDRHPHAALQTSFANGGQISIGYAEPWANPRMPAKIFKWLFSKDSPLVFRPRLDWQQWRWIAGFLSQCRASASERNLIRIVELALHSRRKLREIRELEHIDHAHRQLGIIRFYRSQRELDSVRRAADLIQNHGCPCEVIGVERILEIEPTFHNHAHQLAGGVYTPQDESGDTHRFTQQLAANCSQRGVDFFYNTRATALLQTASDGIRAVETRSTDGYDEIEARHIAICLGVDSAPFLRPYGIDLNLYPVKGYSVSIPFGNSGGSPTVALIDDGYKLVYSNLGDHLRVAGTGELGGYRRDLDRHRCRGIIERVKEIFPDAGDFHHSRFWTDLRPATPSNVPYLGGSRYPNLWLNTGHGTLGWTLSAGSGDRLVSRILKSPGL
ncbi:MAG: D-amino acid dehydrogenase [Gammaproteobacteria bacterium]|nr:D-amino acid dehydrogenase [Gammaproteobacteria bacterium]